MLRFRLAPLISRSPVCHKVGRLRFACIRVIRFLFLPEGGSNIELIEKVCNSTTFMVTVICKRSQLEQILFEPKSLSVILAFLGDLMTLLFEEFADAINTLWDQLEMLLRNLLRNWCPVATSDSDDDPDPVTFVLTEAFPYCTTFDAAAISFKHHQLS